jgi:hypothetical protein
VECSFTDSPDHSFTDRPTKRWGAASPTGQTLGHSFTQAGGTAWSRASLRLEEQAGAQLRRQTDQTLGRSFGAQLHRQPRPQSLWDGMLGFQTQSSVDIGCVIPVGCSFPCSWSASSIDVECSFPLQLHSSSSSPEKTPIQCRHRLSFQLERKFNPCRSSVRAGCR